MLDIVDDKIVAVEILDRPDVKMLLDAVMPLAEQPQSRSERDSYLACPACGFLTVPDDSYGSYSMCSVCDWEDDGVQLSNPACEGGANQLCLIAAQEKALGRFPLGTHEMRGVRRSLSWRALNEAERVRALAERQEKYWMNGAITELADCYWMS